MARKYYTQQEAPENPKQGDFWIRTIPKVTAEGTVSNIRVLEYTIKDTLNGLPRWPRWIRTIESEKYAGFLTAEDALSVAEKAQRDEKYNQFINTLVL